MKRKVYKRISGRIHMPLNTAIQEIPFEIDCAKGNPFTEEDIQDQFPQIKKHVETSFPRYEFRVVWLKPNVIKFIAEKLKGCVSEETEKSKVVQIGEAVLEKAPGETDSGAGGGEEKAGRDGGVELRGTAGSDAASSGRRQK